MIPLIIKYLSVRLPLLKQCSCSLPAPVSEREAGCPGVNTGSGSSTTDNHLLHGVALSPVRQIGQAAVLATGGFVDLHRLTNRAKAAGYYESFTYVKY